ncbi:sodium:proton antiporter [Oleiphilus sp. HI0009]|nr:MULTISPECIES: cation:proton antiporter [unclassified Oleiphilus]KZX77486.1 sodium:proton antiporter [Oleiphilus sp. HI0009]KZY69070.1 sodium:proton antiporter [Oleiphilus sp. HI0067]KZY69387.1 sodium:proton antiporter [Oleiphilus sp. HI0066]MCH2159110.1 cation:proton antiporter [Oleiphilaceae bacterium]
MPETSIVHSFFLIFTGAAIVASFALYARQPLILAYIIIGAIVGPFGLDYVSDARMLSEIAEIGIIFLLFLLGLDMQPKSLGAMFGKASFVAIVSSVAFAGLGYIVSIQFGFTQLEALIIGACMVFSSTIIGIKLLPTTVLHHRHTGELVVALLLIQDLIAILVLLLIGSFTSSEDADFEILELGTTLLMLPFVALACYLIVRFIILPLFTKFDRFHEYMFLLSIGWCLGVAEASEKLGLSLEIGAFIAGISLATSPISQYIAVNLKPLRDFFLVLFFFSLGANFNHALLESIWIPTLILGIVMIAFKPWCFSFLLQKTGELKEGATEVGVRLGQISEFSLMIAFLAFSQQLISNEASHLIQATAILTFIINSYMVIFRYPSPIAVSDKLRRD